MFLQPSQTYSWHVAGYYAVHDRRMSVSIKGNNYKIWAGFGIGQGEIGPIWVRIHAK